MRKNRFRNWWAFNFKPDHLIYRFAEAADPDAGGGEEGTDDTPDLKAYAASTSATIAQLQKDLASAKKSSATTAAELKAIKESITALTEATKASKGQDAEGDEVEEEDDPPRQQQPKKRVPVKAADTQADDVANAAVVALQKQIKDLQSQVKKASDETATERTARVAAETRQRNLERDRSILDAATTVGLAEGVEPQHVLRHFRENMQWDEDAEAWMYVEGDDSLSVQEGVKKHLPKYMQKSKTPRGGSGGGSPNNDNGVSQATLKQNAITLGKQAQKDERIAVQYNKARRAFTEAGGDVTEIIDAVSLGI